MKRLDRYTAPDENFVLVVPHRPRRIAVLGARSAPKETGNQPRALPGYQGQSPWLVLGLAAGLCAGVLAGAQTTTPYKLGTFELTGRAFVGIVLRESVVVDFAAAHAAIRTPASTLAAPVDMKDLIVRYDAGLRARIVDIVRGVEAAGAARPPYAYDLRAVKILPPIVYPTTMLNVAVNYTEHDREMS